MSDIDIWLHLVYFTFVYLLIGLLIVLIHERKVDSKLYRIPVIFLFICWPIFGIEYLIGKLSDYNQKDKT